jgi:hypothetical protein
MRSGKFIPAPLRYNKLEAHARRSKRFFKPLHRNFPLKRILRALLRVSYTKGRFNKLHARVARVYSNEKLYGRATKKYCAYTG